MSKYIDADEFVKKNREWYCEQCQRRKGMKRGKLQFVYEIGGAPCRACDVDDMISDIEDFPAADVEPRRHGWWIPGDRFVYDGHGETVRHPGGITCSQCRYSFAEKYLWSRSYCPHCGAKMDAEPPKEGDDGTV